MGDVGAAELGGVSVTVNVEGRCWWEDCARPARYRVARPMSGAVPGVEVTAILELCGTHMHAAERRGWTVEGKLRRDGR